MGDTVVRPPSEEKAPADSFLNRALNIFISPGRAFDSIIQRPDFIAPLILTIVGSGVFIEAIIQKIGVTRIIRHAIEAGGKAQQLSPEQLDQTVNRAAAFTAISMRVFGTLGIPIFLLIIAAAGLLIANVIFGGSAKFKTCFAVVCYSNLVLQLAVVLGLIMVFMGDPEQFNPENPTPTTLGFFLNPREISKVVYVLASSFDILRVWFIALASMGISRATEKRVGTTAIFLAYLGLWILIVLGHAGMAAIM